MTEARDFLSGFAVRGAAPLLTVAETGVTLSYAEAARLVACLATQLTLRGVGAGDRVVLSLPNSAELALLYLACWWIGATAVAVGPATPPEDRRYMLQLVRPRLVVTPAGDDPCGFDHWKVGSSLFVDVAGNAEAALSCRGGTPSLITFTSGSTGRPKGVCHSLDRLLGDAQAFNRLTRLSASDACLHLMPMTYMAGILNTLLSPWVSGGRVVLAKPFGPVTPLGFWPLVSQQGVTWMWASPTMLMLLLRLARGFTSPFGLRQVFAGTAPLPDAVRTAFAERFGVAVHESYGLSELLFVSSRAGHFDNQPGSVGRLLDGVEAQLRRDGEAAGELMIRTPYQMLGYLDADSGVLLPAPVEWFPTGDLARISADGDIWITGRLKDLIIRGGINVSPRAVEEALMAYPGIAEASVVGVPDEIYGEEIAAALLLADGVELAAIEADLRAHCQRRLGAAALPKYLKVFADLPRASTGKVQKPQLKTRLLEAIAGADRQTSAE